MLFNFISNKTTNIITSTNSTTAQSTTNEPANAPKPFICASITIYIFDFDGTANYN